MGFPPLIVMTATEIEQILDMLTEAINDAKLFAEHRVQSWRFVEVVQCAREAHDALCHALRRTPSLATRELLDLKATSAEAVERLEALATRRSGPLH